jgi:membrane associated rhomboid family serine protease
MTDITAEWEFNQSLILRTLTTTWSASTIMLVLILYEIKSDDINISDIAWIVVLYLVIISTVTITYYSHKTQRRFIFIKSGILHIPRFFLKMRKVDVAEIRSLERYSNSRRDFGILVGLLKRNPIFIDKNFFSSASDFDEFVDILTKISSQIKADNRPEIEVLAQRQKELSNLPIAAVSIILSIVYLLSSSQDFEKINDLFVSKGSLTKGTVQPDQWYRIFSSFFLHISPWHLGLNVLCFALLGRYILVVFGGWRFINIFLLSGIVGALASLKFSGYDAVVGTSGGVLGLLGAYVYVSIRHNEALPGSLSNSFQKLILVLAFQIAFDVIQPGIDISSHISGFIFGIVYAALVLKYASLTEATRPKSFERLIAIGVISAFVYGLQRLICLVYLIS